MSEGQVFSEEIIKKCIIKEIPPLDAGIHVKSESEDGIVFAQIHEGKSYIYDMAIFDDKGKGDSGE